MPGVHDRGTTPRTALTSYMTLGELLYLSHPHKTSSLWIWICLEQLFSTEGNFFFTRDTWKILVVTFVGTGG